MDPWRAAGPPRRLPRTSAPTSPQAVHVLVLDLSRVLRELVSEILSGPGTVVHCETLEGAVAAAADRAGADVVILGGTGPTPPGAFGELARERPETTVVAVVSDGRRAFLYEPLGELDQEALLAAVRRAGAR